MTNLWQLRLSTTHQKSQVTLILTFQVIPFIAIAMGSSIHYYKGTNAFLKFDLPLIQFSEEEKELWKQMSNNLDQQLQPCCEKLFSMREAGKDLSSLSVELLSIETLIEQKQFVTQNG